VLPAVSQEPVADNGVETGDAVDVALRHERARPDLVTYVCGSDQMVRGTLKTLAEAGWPTTPDAVRYEDYDARGYRPTPAPPADPPVHPTPERRPGPNEVHHR
jgi:hypothetical protein